MTVWGTHQAAFSWTPPARWRIAFAGVVLIASILGVSSASASQLTLSVETPAPSLPSSPTQPAVPPVQVEVPTPPQIPRVPVEPVQVEVPTPPRVPAVKAPAADVGGTKPNSSHVAPAPAGGSTKASTPDIHLPAVAGAEGGRSGSPGISREGEPRTAASASSRGSGGHGVSPAGTRAGSLKSARVAPRLLAYVWPAIALEPAQQLLRTLQAGWEAVTSLSLPAVPGLGSGPAVVSGAEPAAVPSERSALSKPSPAGSRDFRGIPLPSGSEISLFIFILACAALVALLIFTLRREYRATHYRWPL